MRAKSRVLVVDDNSDVLEIMKLKISSMGFDVSLATSAVEALGYLAHGLEPALIISDVQMPILSGIEFAQMLRDRGSMIPLMLMSGEASFSRSELDSLRVHSFLPKPLDFALMNSSMRSALNLEEHSRDSRTA